MIIETLRNMPVGLRFCGKTQDDTQYTGEIILEDNEKKIVIFELSDVLNLDALDNKGFNIEISNIDRLSREGYNINDIIKRSKLDYKVDINTILCKNTNNLPVKTIFKYEDTNDEVEVRFINNRRVLWNNTLNDEEPGMTNVRISVKNYNKLYLHGYVRKDIEYLCKSFDIIQVLTFDNVNDYSGLFGRFKDIYVKDLNIEDRINLAKEIILCDSVKYYELYNRFSWNAGYSFARIMFVSRLKPWTIVRDANGFESIQYFDNYDESLKYIEGLN